MSLPGKWHREPAKTNVSGKVDFVGSVLLGVGGAVAASYVAGVDTPGFTVAKVGGEVGRYRIQLVDAKSVAVVTKAFYAMACIVEGAADAVYTTDKGLHALVRNVTPASGFFDIQLTYMDDATGAWVDGEAMDAAKLHISFSAKFSSVVP